jgi:peptidyl-prolyl cis-trans isomerase A (cyclophilin A)
MPRYLTVQIIMLSLFFCQFVSLAGQTAHPTAHPRARTPIKPREPALPPVDLPAEPGTYAVIYTTLGNIVCLLYDKAAPKTVENFIGLARGTKPWKDGKTGRWRHTPLYSGTTFQRVIPDFMIQGGDPAGDGTGEPGYKIPDEIDPKLGFSQPGVLAMANSGPNTDGCQFFITVAPAEHLNGNYSIFGRVVSGQEVADSISKVPRDEANDKPNTPIVIKGIAIRIIKEPAVSKTTPK